MQHTLQFFSVGAEQVAAVLKSLNVADPTALNGIVEGTTVMGDVKGTYDFSLASGQLTVVITEKPALLLVDTIKMKITEELIKALPYVDPMSETPVPAEIVAPAQGTVVVAVEGNTSGPNWKKRKKQAAHAAAIETHGEMVEEKTEAFAE